MEQLRTLIVIELKVYGLSVALRKHRQYKPMRLEASTLAGNNVPKTHPIALASDRN
jgi:hypothetical protein